MTRSSIGRVEMPGTQAFWLDAVRAFPALRRGSGMPGKQLPFLSLGMRIAIIPARKGHCVEPAVQSPFRHERRPLSRDLPAPSDVRRLSQSSGKEDPLPGAFRRGRALGGSAQSPVEVGASNQTLPEHRR
nr:hypothetical protein [Stagnihabitans tardus]